MFILKNAIKNIYRNKSKYIIFGILYLILILTASVSVNIYIQMRQASDKIDKESAGVAKLSYNGGSGDNISPYISGSSKRAKREDILKYTEIEHVDDIKLFKYNFNTTYLKSDVSPLKKELHINVNVIFWDNFHDGSFYISGYNTSLLYLVKDDFKLESGRMFEKNDEAVIDKNRLNTDYSEWNDLDLGDKIVIKNDDGIYKEFTVVGITEQDSDDDKDTYRCKIYTNLESAEYFDVIAAEYQTIYTTISMDMHNKLITSGEVHKLRKYLMNVGYDALVFLDSSSNLGYVQKEMRESGANLEPFFDNYWFLSQLTVNMAGDAMVYMAITGLLIVSVTIISTIISLNSRKYEIAVLRSTGTKKSRLIVSYLIENLVFIWSIAIISLIAAQFISKIFTGNILESIQTLMTAESFDSMTKGLNLELLLKTTGLVFSGTTVVVMLSLILACINIVRFEPLKIFNKRY